MIRIERHPLVQRDLRELARHVANVSGDPRAAERRLDQVEALLIDILKNPNSGASLSAELPGWRVRHGGAGRKITIVFRLTEAESSLQIALVAFGGQNWLDTAPDRSEAFTKARLRWRAENALARGIDDEEEGRTKPLADVVTRLERKFESAGRPTE
jgi:plasmid stabilization system protein ParE